MTQQELNKILDAHEMWLEDNKKGERANLDNLDLRKLDFSRRKLNHIIIRGANCTYTDFTGTSLINAYCTCTNFTGSFLRKAACTNSIFNQSSLSGADCTCTNFTGTRLRNADCTYTDFTGSFLRKADCTYTNFTGASLRFADCTYTNFTGASLRDSYCTGTTLTKTFLAGAILTDTNLPTPIIQIGGIGSRKDYVVYHVAENIVQWGDWYQWSRGSLEEFIDLIDKVEEFIGLIDKVCPETITEPDELKYRREYLAAIEFFKASRDIYLQSIEGKRNEIQARR